MTRPTIPQAFTAKHAAFVRHTPFGHIPQRAFSGPSPMTCFAVGKARAGRLLDGREWNDMPGALANG